MALHLRTAWTWLLVAGFLCNSASADWNSSVAPDVYEAYAIVTVSSPPALANNYLGLFAAFSGPPHSHGDVAAWVPKGDLLGCEPLPPSPTSAAPRVVILRRGKCTFVEKAERAIAAGAAGVIIVSDSYDIPIMQGNVSSGATTVEAPVVGLDNVTGEALIAQLQSHPGEPLILSISAYSFSAWNAVVSEAVIICMATILIVAGAFFATADMRKGSPLAPKSTDEVVDVTSDFAVAFCVLGSGMLIVLFFFMRYLIYVVIVGFCLGGFSAISQIVSALFSYLLPCSRHRIGTVPCVGRISTADVIASMLAACIVAGWIVWHNARYGWVFQDIIGAAFLVWMQRTLRLPNIKVATILLTIMFFFDIFWVFISPLIFQRSVMVEVAKGGGTGEHVPMLLRVPSFGDVLGSERMLGFGDIALPGLLVSYLRRHDILSERGGCAGYFVPSVVGYFVGLCVTIVALTIMKLGQPALLYLVPGTLGTTYVIACIRGEVVQLWEGKPCPGRTDEGSEYDVESDENTPTRE